MHCLEEWNDLYVFRFKINGHFNTQEVCVFKINLEIRVELF